MTQAGERAGRSWDWRPGRRRRWTAEEKRPIVAESEAAGSSVSMVARRHDLNANMLFTWRREFRRREAETAVDRPAFVPAIIAPDEVDADRPASVSQDRTRLEDGGGRRTPGLMEIILAGGSRVIVDGEVSAAALARVIGVLERR